MAAGPDSEQLATLYRRFGPAVHRRALSLVLDSQEALDITQETFLAYFKGDYARSTKASAFTLLYQIATFKSVDRLRARSRWTGALGTLTVDEDSECPYALPGNDGGMRQVEAAQDLVLLTRGEKPEVLTAALLYFVEGHTTEEVAQVLDLSRKTVGKLLSQFAERARKRHQRLDTGEAQ